MTPSQQIFLLNLTGTPWVAGARGPDTFDCWGLLVHIYRELLKIEVDSYPGVNASDVSQVTRIIYAESNKWQEIPIPEPFCAVGLSTGKRIHHVGIWVVDGVLHTNSNHGCIYQTIGSIRRAFPTIKYYRHVSSNPHQ